MRMGGWMSEGRVDKSKKTEERHPIRSFLSFALMLAAVLLVVLFAAYRDGTGFDILRRYLHYGRAEQAGGEVVYHYDAASKNRFALLGESLVVLSDASLRLFGSTGEEVWSAPVTMTSPALAVGGGRAVAYDVGGTALYVLDQSGLVLELTADEEEPYISARLNRDGELAVTAQKKGFKGSVKVYDRALGPEPAFEFKSSQRFVLDGYVLGDTLAAVTLGQEDGVFVSSIVLYEMPKEEPEANCSISGGRHGAGLRHRQGGDRRDLSLWRGLPPGVRPGGDRLHGAAAEPLPLRQRGAAGHRGQGRRGHRFPGRPGGGAEPLRLGTLSGGAVSGPSGGL